MPDYNDPSEVKHIAWTGGSAPALDPLDPAEREYVLILFRQQCETWKAAWGDRPPLDVRRTFMRRARFDAHATYRAEER